MATLHPLKDGGLYFLLAEIKSGPICMVSHCHEQDVI